MILIDTHSHLYAEEFDEDRAAALERALEQPISDELFEQMLAQIEEGGE